MLQKSNPAPKSELEDFKAKTFLISTIHNLDLGGTTILDVKDLEAAEEGEFNIVFAAKCKECCKVCDFSSEIVDKDAKAKKSRYLAEMEKCFTKPRFFRLLDDDSITTFLQMCKVNIGRSYAALKVVSSIECPDNVLDASWPHLDGVYKAMRSLFESKLGSKVDDRSLLVILISNTFSCDDRERQAAKECLSCLYGKNTKNKPTTIHIALDQIRGGNCSAELLGFLYDIAPDISKLLPQQKDEIFNTILKLHNSPLFMKFAKALTQCITRFIRTETSLINKLFQYLSNHWPTYGIKKQVMLIEELESVTQNFPDEMINRETAKCIFERLGSNFLDPGVDVAESSLSFFIGQGNESALIKYIDLAINTVPNLNTCRREHWNVFIRDDARIILDLLSKASPDLFAKQVAVVKGMKKAQKEKDIIRLNTWQEIMKTAKKNDPHLSLSQVTFVI